MANATPVVYTCGMTSSELILWQAAYIGKQIEKTLDGLKDEDWEMRSRPGGMSTAEIVEHLCEASQAMAASSRGEQHEWGSFSIADKSPTNLINTFKDLRAQALDACDSHTEEGQKGLSEYVILHDAYHLGQLCANRLECDPNWNAYSIYEE